MATVNHLFVYRDRHGVYLEDPSEGGGRSSIATSVRYRQAPGESGWHWQEQVWGRWVGDDRISALLGILGAIARRECTKREGLHRAVAAVFHGETQQTGRGGQQTMTR